jgi:CxxC motif-containing protein (DUF1111 family)
MPSLNRQGIPVQKLANILACALVLFLGSGMLLAQTDPGPRPGPAGAGSFFPTLNGTEQAFFTAARDRFKEIDSVSGTVAGEAGVGLGPTFNANSCAACHAQPAVGGTSPAPFSPQVPVPNPQIAVANLDGATNTIPPFIHANGPVREARFIAVDPTKLNSPLDGGVHGLFTIKGRSDAPGCNLSQPDFNFQLANANVSFRIPTPTFGLGLIENTPDATLQANLALNATQKANLGIGGRLNTSGNDGSVTRFGWKAQNKSLVIFAGEAYNVEQGVSNEVFPNERAAVPGCVFNATPEDSTNLTVSGTPASPASAFSSDTVNFAAFMRLAAPPTPTTSTASQLNGQALFSSIGCALCHTPSLTTAASPFTGMGGVTYHPFSDIALHHMGTDLLDGVLQGGAGPDEFRTAPLWGVGQRLFFLHDGRTSNLLTAILSHADDGGQCTTTEFSASFLDESNGSIYQPNSQTQFCGSEANGVIANFRALSPSQKQDILNFLRSL